MLGFNSLIKIHSWKILIFFNVLSSHTQTPLRRTYNHLSIMLLYIFFLGIFCLSALVHRVSCCEINFIGTLNSCCCSIIHEPTLCRKRKKSSLSLKYTSLHNNCSLIENIKLYNIYYDTWTLSLVLSTQGTKEVVL